MHLALMLSVHEQAAMATANRDSDDAGGSIADDAILDHPAVGTSPQDQPLRVDAQKAPLRAQPRDEVPMRKVAGFRRRSQELKHFLLCLPQKRPVGNEVVRHRHSRTSTNRGL